MCVIIDRNPNIEINPEKIESACKVNPDGYGISIIDRGKMSTIKKYSSDGNDAKEVIRILEEAKGFRLFTHLRYSTKGNKDEANCHPFEIFSDGDYKIMFMHNGTLTSMGDVNRSDTREFAEDYLKPMVRAFYEIEGEGILIDKNFEKIIEHFRNGGSVFMLYDSNGECLKLGKGLQHEGWWSSNEYSFNRYHREPQTPFRTTGQGSGAGSTGQQGGWIGRRNDDSRSTPLHTITFNPHRDEYGWYDRGVWIVHIERTAEHREKRKKMEKALDSTTDTCTVTEKKEEEKPTSNVVPLRKEDGKSEQKQEEDFLENECAAIGQAINIARKNGAEHAEHVAPDNRLSFCELADIVDLSDIQILNEEELLEMVERMPLAATILIMDLLYALYKKDTAERVRKAQENLGTDKKEATNG